MSQNSSGSTVGWQQLPREFARFFSFRQDSFYAENGAKRLPEGQACLSERIPEPLQGDSTDTPPQEAVQELHYSSLPLKIIHGPGRPITRPWTRRAAVGNLKVTRAIGQDEAVAFLDAVAHAERKGHGLDYWATLKPGHLDDMPPEHRSAFWINEREWLAQRFRDGGGKLTAVWVRESKPKTGMGEHQHLLFHLPRKLRPIIESALIGRYGGKPTVDFGPASTMPWRTASGHYGSAQTYMLKGVAPQAARASNLLYRSAGPIAGKRIGFTEDLGPRAIAAWRAAHNIVSR
jgi:hypothetical protein